jgi:hypothetical protein
MGEAKRKGTFEQRKALAVEIEKQRRERQIEYNREAQALESEYGLQILPLKIVKKGIRFCVVNFDDLKEKISWPVNKEVAPEVLQADAKKESEEK